MGLLFLFLAVIAFVLYFYGIGLWYLGLLPFAFLLILLIYYTSKFSVKDGTMKILEKHGMLVAWIVLLGGLTGVGHFLGIELIMIAKALFAINLVLWMLSYLIKYEDGKIVFQVGYYMSLLFLFITVGLQVTIGELLDLLTLIWALHVGVTSFIVFVVGIRHDIEDYIWYKLLVLLIGAILLMIIKLTTDMYVAIFLCSAVLTILYYIGAKLNDLKPISKSKQEDISLRRILAGERILKRVQQPQSSEKLMILANFVHNMPGFAKFMLEGTNMLLVGLLLITYLLGIGETIPQMHQILFWLVIVLFTTNVLLLKRLGFTSVVQKLVVFTVANFAIYATLFALFQGNYGEIALWGIVWNVLSGIAIFYAPSTLIANALQKRDYLYRVGTTVAALVANIILLAHSDLQGQLIFSFVFLYLGLQGMILFYALKYIRKLHN